MMHLFCTSLYCILITILLAYSLVDGAVAMPLCTWSFELSCFTVVLSHDGSDLTSAVSIAVNN